jgi:hypothetical protein
MEKNVALKGIKMKLMISSKLWEDLTWEEKRDCSSFAYTGGKTIFDAAAGFIQIKE